ncbi:MAG: ATP-binding protein, partial [Bacteroidetes bacterium]|nr:ATP-binding protein [Bacteroidota bacterium]
MSKLQDIEAKLITINDAVFQDLCDAYLYYTETDFSSINRIGSKKGKQKTTKGRPDSYFKTNNGQYVFVEYTTQARGKNPKTLLRKIRKDILDCLDEKTTKIKNSQISKIIYCCNSEILPSEDKEFSQLCLERGITLEIKSIDTLSMALLGRCQFLAKQFLGISIDTHQILTLDTFIEEYESTGYATQLSNKFLHRENEVAQLGNLINTSQISVLTGPPGVGKSKLVIESIRKLQKDNIYTIYCITNKGEVLHDDLRTYLAEDKPYILFVDDANRQSSHLTTILGILKEKRNNKISVLITVREYALQPILDVTKEFHPKILQIGKLSDDEIKGVLISDDFQIYNSEYQNRIIEIADGNPRLAIMAAKVAKQKQTLEALKDVSEIYDNYFENSLPDSQLLTDNSLLKTLGILSFFYTINLENKEFIKKVCADFALEESAFKEAITKLEEYELVETSTDYSVVKIAEQVLGTYFFFTTFLKNKILDFALLLNNYFDTYNSRINDTVIPANNTFGHTKVAALLQPYLSNFWKEIKFKEDTALKYLDLFWFHSPEETFAFIYEKVQSLPDIIDISFKFDEEKVRNYHSYSKDLYLEILTKFFDHSTEYLADSIELALEYTNKNADLYSQLVHKLSNSFKLSYQDQRYQFFRQKELLKVITDKTQSKDSIYNAVFFDVTPELLKTTYMVFTSTMKRNEISYYQYKLPFNKDIKQIRSTIWDYYILKLKGNKNENKCIEFMLSYLKREHDYDKKIYSYDLTFLQTIINKHFSTRKFSHAYIVQDAVHWFSRIGIRNKYFSPWRKKFRNRAYEIYALLSQDILRDKFDYEYDNLDYREYEKLKEEEIRKQLQFQNLKEFSSFYSIYVEVDLWKSKYHISFVNSLNIVLHQNEIIRKGNGLKFLLHILEKNNLSGFIPYGILEAHLSDCSQKEKDSLYCKLIEKDFQSKDYWLLSYFNYLPENKLNNTDLDRLILTLKNAKSGLYIDLSNFERFSGIRDGFNLELLKTIVNRNKDEQGKILLSYDFFEKWVQYFKKNLTLLKTAYLQQGKLHQHFDHDYKDLIEIVKIDNRFLIEYINHVFTGQGYTSYRELDGISSLWKLENAEEIMPEVLDLLMLPRFNIFRDEFCDSFFKGLSPVNKERACIFLRTYLTNNLSNIKKVNMVLDTVRHLFNERFKDMLLYYLSLNNKFEDFKKLNWTESHYSGSG